MGKINRLPADLDAVYLAGGFAYAIDQRIGPEILKQQAELYRRLRNTLRFMLANLADFDPARDGLPVDEWLEIDRYAWVMTQDLQSALAKLPPDWASATQAHFSWR
mgnify:CR=1 FL=1